MSAATITFEPGLASIIGMHSVVDRLTAGAVAPLVAYRAGELMSRPPSGVLIYGAAGCGVRTIAHALVSDVRGFGARSCGELDAPEPLPDPVVWGDELLVGWSHRPWDLSIAVGEPGRFELLVFVPPPDWDARRFRAWELLARAGFDSASVDQLVVATEGWSGSDIEALIDECGGVDEVLDRAANWRPTTWNWLIEARAGTVDGALARGTDDLRVYLDRYRLS